ncbi:hypothetical protein B0I27_109106 [Arcticibacter pallidicorallinus]|uniref:Uncharacterized protein n=1 Tax=Arcticibacter pallidicorallinus TaxID=1259464 RepID=A0A2T0TXK6_9SPHI|nr:hypothetical protein B0I27_109106 [Arcticibacter pallidicorallinus]
MSFLKNIFTKKKGGFLGKIVKGVTGINKMIPVSSLSKKILKRVTK